MPVLRNFDSPKINITVDPKEPFAIIAHQLQVNKDTWISQHVWKPVFTVEGKPWPNPLRVQTTFEHKEHAAALHEILLAKDMSVFKNWDNDCEHN